MRSFLPLAFVLLGGLLVGFFAGRITAEPEDVSQVTIEIEDAPAVEEPPAPPDVQSDVSIPRSVKPDRQPRMERLVKPPPPAPVKVRKLEPLPESLKGSGWIRVKFGNHRVYIPVITVTLLAVGDKNSQRFGMKQVTNSDRPILFKGLRKDAVYRIEVRAAGYHLAVQESVMASTTDVELTMVPDVRVKVLVEYENGMSPDSAALTLDGKNRRMRMYLQKEWLNSTPELSLEHFGTWTVIARQGSFRSDPVVFTVGADNATAEVRLVLREKPFLLVYLSEPDGSPALKAQLSVGCGGSTVSIWKNFHPDRDGNCIVEFDMTDEYIWLQAIRPSGLSSETLTLQVAGAPRHVTVVLPPKSEPTRVMVKDHKGKPVSASFEVRWYDAGARYGDELEVVEEKTGEGQYDIELKDALLVIGTRTYGSMADLKDVLSRPRQLLVYDMSGEDSWATLELAYPIPEEFEVVIPEPATIRGRFTGLPERGNSGTGVILERDNDELEETAVGLDGRFSFEESVGPGEYVLRVSEDVIYISGNCGVAGETAWKPIPITLHSGVNDLRVAAPPLCTLGVRVDRGANPESAEVEMIEQDGDSFEYGAVLEAAIDAKLLDDNATIQFFRLPPGNYRVTVRYTDEEGSRRKATSDIVLNYDMEIALYP